MFEGSHFCYLETSSLSSYFTWNKFVIVSLMKNLLWKVLHIAALMFSFGRKLTVLTKNAKKRFYSIVSVTFMCLNLSSIIISCQLRRLVQIVHPIEQTHVDPIQTTFLTFIFNSTYSGGLMHAQYFRGQNSAYHNFISLSSYFAWNKYVSTLCLKNMCNNFCK